MLAEAKQMVASQSTRRVAWRPAHTCYPSAARGPRYSLPGFPSHAFPQCSSTAAYPIRDMRTLRTVGSDRTRDQHENLRPAE